MSLYEWRKNKKQSSFHSLTYDNHFYRLQSIYAYLYQFILIRLLMSIYWYLKSGNIEIATKMSNLLLMTIK